MKQKNLYSGIAICILTFSCFTVIANAAKPSTETITIGDTIQTDQQPNGRAPYFFAEIDAAGFSDWIWYGRSPIHSQAYHETLSGEWGAAIYYDGIDTAQVDPNDPASPKKAMWLTDKFLLPYWYTDNDFLIYDAYTPSAWNSSCNPTPENNTGRSIIKNTEVKVQIDYEVADVGIKGSPMSFYKPCPDDPNNIDVFFMPSDRYVILQTYTITNIDPNNATLKNLEFYQMLHSHGADEYNDAVCSTYETYPYEDPLESYTPCNPVHTVGNFRYDITQWNDTGYSHASVNHEDWVGFSCAVEPNWVDTGYYRGGHYPDPDYKPPYGTHINIENRDLNNETSIYEDEAAGAMGWFLGDIDAGESVSRTIVFMFGTGPIGTEVLVIEKSSSVTSGGCAGYREEFSYTITYTSDANEMASLGTLFDVQIIDYLPEEVDFESASDGGQYSSTEHTVTWSPDPDYITGLNWVTVNVSVNDKFAPGGSIENLVKIVFENTDGQKYFNYDSVIAGTCDCANCGGIIYVDADNNIQDPNGSDWSYAYKKLEDALAAAGPCDEIWVAQGTYTPQITSEPNMYFDIPRYVSLLGGFLGSEDKSYQRNWLENATILSGDVPEDEDLDYVVNVSVEQALVDGFTITDGSLAGVYCENGTVFLEHNKITSNENGIYCNDTGNSIIRNNLIYENQYGIYLKNTVETKIVNNTLVDNSSAGIYSEASIDPYISNCIIWDDAEINDIVDCNAIYSCLTDGSAGQGNIDGDPNFPPFVDGVDDYHLDPCSACIDAGDPAGDYTGERDIDKHFRVLDGDGDDEKRVDMGADEYCNQGTDNLADFNEDDIVDTADLIELAAAWLIDNNDPCWVIKYYEYDLYDDDVIDYIDFAYFAKEWLWMTCDKMQGYEMMEMMMGMGGGESMLISPTAPLAAATQQQISEVQAEAEPSVEEQIEQIKELLDWLYEIKDDIDEDTWLNLTGSLEEILKELQQ